MLLIFFLHFANHFSKLLTSHSWLHLFEFMSLRTSSLRSLITTTSKISELLFDILPSSVIFKFHSWRDRSFWRSCVFCIFCFLFWTVACSSLGLDFSSFYLWIFLLRSLLFKLSPGYNSEREINCCNNSSIKPCKT